MKAIIINFRGSRRRKNFSQIILKVDKIDDKKKAEGLIGKEVVWKTSSGKEINGKVTASHGNKGAVRVKFEKGLPGQCLGTEIKVE